MVTKQGQASFVFIDNQKLTLEDVVQVARFHKKVELSDSTCEKIQRTRRIVEKFIEEERVVYGITTGLGDLCKVRIQKEHLNDLSKNIIMSHACGVGEPLCKEQVRAIMFAAVLNYSQGYSGLRLESVKTLVDMLNHGITPWTPSQGSVGYLTHMAHIALVMIGLGRAYYEGELMTGRQAMEKAGIPILSLEAKEGLSLVNGTVCMTGISALTVYDAINLAKWADIAGAMSFESLKGSYCAYDERIQKVKPFKGQAKVAKNLLSLIKGSEIAEKFKHYRVQDALSIRAIPQVHGACRDKIDHAREVVEIELNSATDNPLIFEDENGGISISSCNPHGESIALTMDMLAIAGAELAGISERRTARLVTADVSGLPPFLVKNSGLHTGFMIPQYAAASLVAENKVYTHPISVDSLTMSGFQEDHVSMGTPAALKANKVLKNTQKVIAIEMLTAAQALEFHHPLQLGEGTETIYQFIRRAIPSWDRDREFYIDLEKMISIVEKIDGIKQIEARIGNEL
ncbi:histidine ammonia-lyase [Bacillus songklensis]|uniref:Histidine ammonia-lyase n=1 Tax=Bacillus songklensis TaxID=1069116 RepID=A0ABV8B831_9BACI